MSVEAVSDGVLLLTGRIAYRINQYLLGDVLVDSGTPTALPRLLRDLRHRTASAHAITHAHPDHYGSSRAIGERLAIPVWCPGGDAADMERRRLPHSERPLGRLLGRLPAPAPPPVARRLEEGDEVGGFRVIATPGHSPGHVCYWREADRVLIAGDVVFNVHPLTGRVGIREPPEALTVDPPANRRAIRRLASLEPRVVLFGHGPPLRDPRPLIALARRVDGTS